MIQFLPEKNQHSQKLNVMVYQLNIISMKKRGMALLVGCAFLFGSCHDDSNGKSEGTGVMDQNMTMTTHENKDSTTPTAYAADSSSVDSQNTGKPPGSDNPRKVDLDGQSGRDSDKLPVHKKK
jgi:hypothetical protein